MGLTITLALLMLGAGIVLVGQLKRFRRETLGVQAAQHAMENFHSLTTVHRAVITEEALNKALQNAGAEPAKLLRYLRANLDVIGHVIETIEHDPVMVVDRFAGGGVVTPRTTVYGISFDDLQKFVRKHTA